MEEKNVLEEGLIKYLGRILPGNIDRVTYTLLKDGISIDYMIDNITANLAKYSLGESSIKPFLESLNSIRTKESRLLRNLGKRVNDRKLIFNERKESPDCNTILAYFAAWVASKVAPKNFQFVRELVILMQMLRTVLNKHGQKYTGKSSKQATPDADAEFCSGTKIGVVLYLSSLFISELFPVLYEKQRQIWYSAWPNRQAKHPLLRGLI
jgi:hypothetical protein